MYSRLAMRGVRALACMCVSHVHEQTRVTVSQKTQVCVSRFCCSMAKDKCRRRRGCQRRGRGCACCLKGGIRSTADATASARVYAVCDSVLSVCDEAESAAAFSALCVMKPRLMMIEQQVRRSVLSVCNEAIIRANKLCR